MVIAAITGHRPEKIPDMDRVYHALIVAYQEHGVTRVIQGMAAGVDLTSAKAAYASAIPFVCARPWFGHMPRVTDRKNYEAALKHAAETVAVDPANSYPGAWVYQKRNEWMVDNADIVIAVWDGTKGGTANCVKYAEKVGKPIVNLAPVIFDLQPST